MSKFAARPEKTRVIKKIVYIMPEATVTPPTGRRLYICEAWGGRDKTRLVPMTFDHQWAEAQRLTSIQNGDLHDAFILHLAMGRGAITNAEKENYPWWKSYYNKMITDLCMVCQVPLGEDRCVSRYCSHQACTCCGSFMTVRNWDAIRHQTDCFTCNVQTRFYVFNGEQTDDGRSHSDAICYELF